MDVQATTVTLSCHNWSLRAHLKLMLYFDIVLQSTRVKRELTASVEHEEGTVMERAEKKREREGKWRRKVRGEGGSETELR